MGIHLIGVLKAPAFKSLIELLSYDFFQYLITKPYCN